MANDAETIILRGRDPITNDALAEQLRTLRRAAGALGAGIVRAAGPGRWLIEALEMERSLLREGEEIRVEGALMLPPAGNQPTRPGRLESDLLTFAPLHGLVLVPFEEHRDPSLATIVFGPRRLTVTDDAVLLAARALESSLAAATRFAAQIRYLEGSLTRTEYYSDRDPLTHALNRRGFVSLLRRIEKTWHTRQIAYTIIVADLDHLKEINDREGHAAGDALLVRFVDAIRANVREPENVGRLGGDEFAIVAQLRAPSETQILLNRLRSALDAAGIAASLGAASHEVPMSLEELLALADRAMYADKLSRHELDRQRAPSLFEPMTPVGPAR
jgi:diguanylate cyclase (GGDEF)-like protein